MRARRPLATISRASETVSAPNSGKSGVETAASQLLFPVTADVFEEQIAERDVREPVGDCERHCRSHGTLVDVVRTR